MNLNVQVSRPPRVIASGEVNGDAYLVMTYLEEGASGSQRQLGQLVAQLHSQQQEEGKFGFITL